MEDLIWLLNFLIVYGEMGKRNTWENFWIAALKYDQDFEEVEQVEKHFNKDTLM
jgi:hypothetical protein